MVYSDNGCAQQKWAIKPGHDMEETKMHITKWKKPIWKGYILHDIQLHDLLEKVKLEK